MTGKRKPAKRNNDLGRMLETPRKWFPNAEIERRGISVRQFAVATNQSVSTARRQLKRAKVPFYTISIGAANCGHRYLVEDLERFLLGRRRTHPGLRNAAPRSPGL